MDRCVQQGLVIGSDLYSLPVRFVAAVRHISQRRTARKGTSANDLHPLVEGDPCHEGHVCKRAQTNTCHGVSRRTCRRNEDIRVGTGADSADIAGAIAVGGELKPFRITEMYIGVQERVVVSVDPDHRPLVLGTYEIHVGQCVTTQEGSLANRIDSLRYHNRSQAGTV